MSSQVTLLFWIAIQLQVNSCANAVNFVNKKKPKSLSFLSKTKILTLSRNNFLNLLSIHQHIQL